MLRVRSPWLVLLATLALLLMVGCPPGGVLVDDDAADDDAADDDDDSGPAIQDDLIEIEGSGMADVLFVVDNSCSMAEEQTALMDNFFFFLDYLLATGSDYHIGITVLDDWQNQPPIGQLYGSTKYIDSDTPNPVDAFHGNMTMGDDGMGQCEVGLEATYLALTEPLLSDYNAGFYREEAELTVVIVSDEIDGSAGECKAIGHVDFTAWLSTLKPTGLDRVHFAAIVGDYPGGCSSSWGDADPGHGYHEVVEALGPNHALEFSICEQDWSSVMTDLGMQATSPTLSFPLTLEPAPGTLVVYADLDGAGPTPEMTLTEDGSFTLPYSYIYDDVDNAILFDVTTVPPVGAVLRLHYEVAD